jgi:SSS family solute:Na+ symporter
VVTILVSLATSQKKSDAELAGLVSSLTPRQVEHETAWYKRPFMLGIFALVLVLILNIIFW